ncbi:uncharacterized protein LOC121417899 [Lytechinus variegatus]|uniref:uncharacterized protein LOC121417899 n=1 Tax=Lytechinus variegatus TaxID=7654 RepID=UPI001BB0F8DC|nr:uncharacterized protein LOC121417899 [Lytechinus variegatus]
MEFSQYMELGKEAGLSGKELIDFAKEMESKQRDERRKDREHQKELKELELKLASQKVQDVKTSSHPGRDNLNIKLPLFNEKTDDMDSFLRRFERYARSLNWEESQWALPLSTLLTGKALEVYSRMPDEEACEYDTLKAALLRRYDLTAEGFRSKFRFSRVEAGETYTQFGDRLKRYLHRWVELSSMTENFEGLVELMTVDQIYAGCGKEMKQFLKERRPEGLGDLTKLAEQYCEAHPNMKENKAKDSSSKRPVNGQAPSGEQRKGHKSGSSGCFICGKGGHLAKACPSAARSNFKKGAALEEIPSNSEKGGACKEMNTVMYSEARQPGSYVKLSSGDELPLLEAGGVSGTVKDEMPVVQGKVGGHIVSVLRDSGCSTTIVKSKYVRPDQYLNIKKRVALIDRTIREFPVARIWVDTPYYIGQLDALVLENPLYELILGNVTGVRKHTDPDPDWTLELDDDDDFDAEIDIDSEIPSEGGAVETRGQKAQKLKPLKPLPTAKALSLATSKADFQHAQKEDETLGKYWKAAETGALSITGKGNETRFLVKRGLLYREFRAAKQTQGGPITQLCVPKGFREGVMALAHDGIMAGHLKVQKTLDRLQQSFCWPRMAEDVRCYCISCDICQRTIKKGSVGRVPLESTPLIDTPFKRVAIDLVGPLDPKTDRGNRYILTLVDYATRYPEAIPLPNIETERIAEALLEIFSRLGLPDEILTDRGSQFMSGLMKELGRLLSVKQLTTTPYHPMCNGLVERFNGTLKTMLKRMCAERPKDWDRYIPALLFAYREVPQASLSFSPFELLYGRTVRGPLSLIKTIWEEEDASEEVKTTYEYVVDLRARMEETCKLAQEELKRASARYKKYYDTTARDRKFAVGDKVLILRPTSASKLLMQWQGPYEIKQKVGRCDVRIEVNGRLKTYHVNLLKKYIDRSGVSDLNQAASISVVEEEHDHDRPCIGFPALIQTEDLQHVIISDKLTDTQGAQARQVLAQFEAQLTDVPGRTNTMQCTVKLTSNDPVVSKPYPLPQSTREAVKSEITDMLRLGVIEKSESRFASPIVLVKKKDGTNRFCVDYRKLNAVTVFDPEPVPNADDLLSNLAKGCYFSKLDLSKGYWQIPMAAEDKEKTAFVTSEGLFHFTVLPFGMVNAPATFSRLMRRVLSGLDGVVNYIDDILVYSETWEGHVRALVQVFTRLAEAGLTAKPSKCQIGFQSLDFLGHVVGEGTLRPDPAKLDQILHATPPTTKKEVRAFLGLAGYYRKFIPNFATIAAPLTDLTKKNGPNKVEWGPIEERAFQTLKSRLTSSPILHLPNQDEPYILATDASDVGIGAVLMQRVGEEKFPIAYASRKLSDTERRYAVIERECLAIAWAVKKFNVYLYGTEFELEVDHRPLMYLAQAKLQNSRILRWALALQSYRYHVTAVRGIDNVGADFLSRCPEQ